MLIESGETMPVCSIEKIIQNELHLNLDKLKNDISSGNIELSFDINRVLDTWDFKFFTRKKKLIQELLSNTILTGSRALYCYKIDGNFILNRKPKDWDFLMDDYSAYHFCLDNGYSFNKFTKEHVVDLNENIDSYGYKTNSVEILLRHVDKYEYDMYSNVKVSALQHIISEKINFFREKDILDIKEIFKNIYVNKK